jgi:hypothetical protein
MNETTFTVFYCLGYIAILSFCAWVVLLVVELAFFLLGKTLKHVVAPIVLSLFSLVVSLTITAYGVVNNNRKLLLIAILCWVSFIYLGWDDNLKE